MSANDHTSEANDNNLDIIEPGSIYDQVLDWLSIATLFGLCYWGYGVSCLAL